MDRKKMREELAESLLKKRILIIDSALDDANIDFIHTGLLALDNESNREIQLYFRSGGGNASAGLIIYETLRTLHSPTKGIVFSAGSAAGVVLQGCSKRVSLRNGTILIHSPAPNAKLVEQLRYNDRYQAAVLNMTKGLKSMKRKMVEIYLERTKMNRDQLQEVFRSGDDNERWMDGIEAKRLGIVDELIPPTFRFPH